MSPRENATSLPVLGTHVRRGKVLDWRCHCSRRSGARSIVLRRLGSTLCDAGHVIGLPGELLGIRAVCVAGLEPGDAGCLAPPPRAVHRLFTGGGGERVRRDGTTDAVLPWWSGSLVLPRA